MNRHNQVLRGAIGTDEFSILAAFPFPHNGFVAVKEDVGGCEVVQPLKITLVFVVIDADPDLAFDFPGQIVILKQQAGSSWSGAVALKAF